MNESATSLDRLHDIVVPEPIPLWPPAPGWYVVILFSLCTLSVATCLWWKRWRASAYRREALRELSVARSAATISELLRRTALAIEARSDVAAPVGATWPDWLAAHCPDEPMPSVVRDQLSTGAYERPKSTSDVSTLRAYAARWIAHHRITASGR